MSIVVVNNIEGKCIANNRLSLRQGDLPSMFFFSFGIDPLIALLDKKLRGIPVYSLPVSGPVPQESLVSVLPVLEEKFKVISYADDIKPAIVNMDEFDIVNEASALFEAASGCKLHRDPSSNKCKFLPLGKWRNNLKQEDLPPTCQYLKLSDCLDMVGVQIYATWTQTRKANGDIVTEKVKNLINSWKSGKFLPLTLRPWSINSFALSKVWFKCGSVDLRICDISAINSAIKSWLYADLLVKPAEAVMCRPASSGGLNVVSVKYKALATLIRTFLETAAIPQFRHNLYHTSLYRYHILEDTGIPYPGFPPYYSEEFFRLIKWVKYDKQMDILSMRTGQWTKVLTENGLTGIGMNDQLVPCKAELASPRSDWDTIWRLCRLDGLDSELASFNFKLIHGLLITRKGLLRLNLSTNTISNLCTDQAKDSIVHSLIYCSFNNKVI